MPDGTNEGLSLIISPQLETKKANVTINSLNF